MSRRTQRGSPGESIGLRSSARGNRLVAPWGAPTTLAIMNDAATSQTRILVIGLDPYRVPGPWDPRPIAEAIENAAPRYAEEGLEVENCLLGLDGDDIEAVVTAALRAHSWDCVVVGGGIRKPEELLEMFEVIVNLIRQYAPQAAIAFNRSPADIVDAAARWLR